jgi:hypothetical protein
MVAIGSFERRILLSCVGFGDGNKDDMKLLEGEWITLTKPSSLSNIPMRG